jgi:hypothetical protein
MSKMAELTYDIEQLFIDGVQPVKIAQELGIPVTMVYDWVRSVGCEQEDLSPFNTFNS